MSSWGYRKGRAFEYTIKKLFENAGYSVTRSASSKGIWDLTAVKVTARNRYTVYLAVVAQCKANKV